MKIFVSNQLEFLMELLKKELFKKTHHPFDKKWVVVPNERVKQDLFLKWAQDPDLQVATGCKMVTWSQALSRCFPQQPSQIELSLKIEAILASIKDKRLSNYLKQGGPIRKASLCDHMATLFLHYLNQPEEQLQQWLAKEGWQQALWRAVFEGKNDWQAQSLLEGAVYLFNPFQLSSYQLAAFKQMEATCFLFSPCSMYWGDFHTFREQRYLLQKAQDKNRGELLQFFEGEHPLLANWGRKGRELLNAFEDEEWTDQYQINEPNSLLKTLQHEMLTLSLSEKILDSSIQIHAAPSKLREVEVVWEIIQRLPFKPEEILVLAPDIQTYAPLIELVFRQRGGPFDFAIFGLEARCKSPLMQGLEALLELPRYRFSQESVEKLLFCPPFLKKFNFTIQDAHLLVHWMQQVRIRYDLTSGHNSWKEGLKRLVEALVLSAQEHRLTIDFSEADVLSRWIVVIQQFENIKADEQTLKEWSETLKSLVDQFFIPDPDDDFMTQLDKFQRMDIEGTFPFSSIERVLKNIFQQKNGSLQASHLQAVRFTSFDKGALMPAKAVILMGMEEGSFPRQDLPSSLQEMPINSRLEEEQYLFLEALCHAREMLIITYLRIHPEDGQSQKACSLVLELSRYCSNIPIIEHPFSPFDPTYFQEEGFQSFSKIHFEGLKKNNSSTPHVPELPLKELSNIDVGKLRRLARHPLQYFFEERLGIDFEWSKSDTEFMLSPLDKIHLRKASLKRPLIELLAEMEKEGKLPVGSFAKAAVQKIQEEIETYHEMIAKLGVKPEEIYSIELKASCKQPLQIDARTWIYPALSIHGILIQGRIDEISPQGLLFHGEDNLADQLKAWPLLLLMNRLGLTPRLLLTKKGKISEPNISSDSLERYIQYAQKALTMPSPLHPLWAKGLLKEGKIPSMDDDEIFSWVKKRHLLPPMDLWLKEWNPYLQEVVHDLL